MKTCSRCIREREGEDWCLGLWNSCMFKYVLHCSKLLSRQPMVGYHDNNSSAKTGNGKEGAAVAAEAKKKW